LLCFNLLIEINYKRRACVAGKITQVIWPQSAAYNQRNFTILTKEKEPTSSVRLPFTHMHAQMGVTLAM
jgi:hypothetical protein